MHEAILNGSLHTTAILGGMPQVSVFEALMILCFGAAWPLSIFKSWRARRNDGKSLPFLVTVFIGYVSGVIHKLLYSYDPIIMLYVLNGVLVFLDICLYFRNAHLMRRAAAVQNGPD